MSGPKRDFSEVRLGEKDRTWYRCERVFRNKKGWYFHTREGIEVGPYTCRFDAEVDLESLIGKIRELSGPSVEHAIHCQAVNASSGNYMSATEAYTGYLVEEGGVEILRGVRRG